MPSSRALKTLLRLPHPISAFASRYHAARRWELALSSFIPVRLAIPGWIWLELYPQTLEVCS